MTISRDTPEGTRVYHPLGGIGTIISWNVSSSFNSDWVIILFDKTKNRAPWHVKRFELTEIKE